MSERIMKSQAGHPRGTSEGLGVDAQRGRQLAPVQRGSPGDSAAAVLVRGLQASRRGVILAREEERRRLRRELHDGLGPTLAALTMQLEVAAALVCQDPGAAGELLTQLGRMTQTVVGDIRRIVDDLRPAGLDELGLISAIREHVQPLDAVSSDHTKGFAIEIRAPGHLGELPAAVEVAAFRIAVAGVTIASRDPDGQHCVVGLRRGTELSLDIFSDSPGFQTPQAASDIELHSMQEWVAELGGECTIEPSSDRAGCTIRVRLPLPGAQST